MIPFWGEKNRAKIISVDGKGLVFPMKLKLQWESFEKKYQKREFQKRSNEFHWDKSAD